MAIPNVNFIRCIQPLSSTHQGHVDGLKESLEIYDLTFTLQCVCVCGNQNGNRHRTVKNIAAAVEPHRVPTNIAVSNAAETLDRTSDVCFSGPVQIYWVII